MKKIGFLIMALILALGTLGIGYAAWVDEVTITGSVDTGSLDLEVVDYSGMWFWKVPGGTPEYFFTVDPKFVPAQVPGNPAPFVVAYAKSQQTMAGDPAVPVDDAITMTFSELFPIDSPCVPIWGPDGDDADTDMDSWGCQFGWRADFVLHYNGSIPAMVDAAFTDATGDAAWLWENGYAWVEFYYLDESYKPGDNLFAHKLGAVTGPVQMHYCDYIWGMLIIEIPQVPPEGLTQDDFMNLVGTFVAKITAIQWNEYVP